MTSDHVILARIARYVVIPLALLATFAAFAQTPQPIRLSAEVLKAYVGQYNIIHEADEPPPPGLPPLEISADRDGLTVQFAGPEKFLPISVTEFFSVSNPDSRLIFTKDANDRVTGFRLTGLKTGRTESGDDIVGPSQIRAEKVR